jgi:hypothetical protein
VKNTPLGGRTREMLGNKCFLKNGKRGMMGKSAGGLPLGVCKETHKRRSGRPTIFGETKASKMRR